jgi:hypothetical protein
MSTERASDHRSSEMSSHSLPAFMEKLLPVHTGRGPSTMGTQASRSDLARDQGANTSIELTA